VYGKPVTSRPLAMYGIARRTKHANQITVAITSMHAKALLIGTALNNISSFPPAGRPTIILSAAFRHFLHGKVRSSTPRFTPAPA